MKLIRSFTVGVLGAMLLASTAGAAIKEDRASLSIGMADYHFDTKIQGSSRTLYSLGVGYDWTQKWGAELMASRFKSRKTYAGDLLEGNEWSLTGLRHYCENSNVVPFVMAGLGYQSLDQSSALNQGSRFAHIGGGMKYYFAPTWALRVDGRFILSRLEDQSATATAHPMNQNRSVMLGLSKRFDFVDNYHPSHR